jgi:hypothetical protein
MVSGISARRQHTSHWWNRQAAVRVPAIRGKFAYDRDYRIYRRFETSDRVVARLLFPATPVFLATLAEAKVCNQ